MKIKRVKVLDLKNNRKWFSEETERGVQELIRNPDYQVKILLTRDL